MVRVDQRGIDVTENCIIRLKVKKNSTTSQERFNVSSVRGGDKVGITSDKPTFSSSPFEEWLQRIVMLSFTCECLHTGT
jgi:hypothetical protein